MRSCCVPACQSGPQPKRLVRFPKDGFLRVRWLQAIKRGTGGHTITDCPNLRICVDHFTQPAGGELGDQYQEPTQFKDGKGTLTVLASCRLCHRFKPQNETYSTDGSVVDGVISKVLAREFRIRYTANDFSHVVCQECVVKMDVVRGLQDLFTVRERGFARLQSKAATLGETNNSEDEDEHPKVIKFAVGLNMERVVTVTKKPIREKEASNLAPKINIVKIREKKSKPAPKKPPMWVLRNKKCYICNTVLEDCSELVEHLSTDHFSEEGHTCQECNDGIVYAEALWYNNHLHFHDPERQLKCNFCPVRYCSLNSLRKHENDKHGTKHQLPLMLTGKRNAQCDICGKMIHGTSQSLLRHIAEVHERKHKYHCKVCQKTFFTTNSLSKHMLSHTKQYPHKCDLCKKRFRDATTLSRHIQGEHEGKQPYSCPTCDLQFSTHGAYVHHRHTIHRNQRTYTFTCKLCEEIPQSRPDLEDHISKSHPNEPYPYLYCSVCGNQLLTTHDLTKHTRRHEEAKNSKDERFRCEHCDKSYAKKVYLSMHVKNVHPAVWAEQHPPKKSKYDKE